MTSPVVPNPCLCLGGDRMLCYESGPRCDAPRIGVATSTSPERLQELRARALTADVEPISDPVELATQSIRSHLQKIGAWPVTEVSTEVKASYTPLVLGGIPDGSVARTVEAADGIMVDVDSDGRVLGVEVIGDGDWMDGLVALAIKGRLAVLP
jgi:uncharacterized protein YuzE